MFFLILISQVVHANDDWQNLIGQQSELGKMQLEKGCISDKTIKIPMEGYTELGCATYINESENYKLQIGIQDYLLVSAKLCYEYLTIDELRQNRSVTIGDFNQLTKNDGLKEYSLDVSGVSIFITSELNQKQEYACIVYKMD